MVSDLDQFKQTFIQEATELLEDMEDRLIAIDQEDDFDIDDINAIFRCAHSIKGGAGSFGFTRLVNFTHILEFLLDNLRNEEMELTPEITDALLSSVDIVSALVDAARNDEEAELGMEDEMAANLNLLNENKGQVNDSGKNEPVKAQDAKPDDEAYGIFDSEEADSAGNGSGDYQITFQPYKSLFVNGNEPLFLIRELKKVCDEIDVEIDTSKVPNLEDLEPIDCYINWSIKVKNAKSLESIQEVFEFVEGECLLDISPLSNSKNEQGKEGLKEEAFGIFEDDSSDSKAESLDDPDGAFGLFEDTPSTSGSADEKADSNLKSQSATPAPMPKATDDKKTAKLAPKTPAKKASDMVTSIRVDIDKVDRMVNMVGELVITQAMILQLLKDIPEQYLQQLMKGMGELSRHTRDLQESVMSVRMQPVKSIFSRMPRIVRDLSRKLNKSVRLEMKGEATEIDKTVIEQLSDPLVHMIRNSLDHGLETPDEREAAGKPREGTILLSADSSGGRIIIEITDNGRGINREKVFAKAVEKGLFPEDANLKPEEIDNIIFMPGFSTADALTDVSGRGVGMDVVNKNIKDLGGEINLTNNPGEGSSFSISLPLTLAILDGMIIQVCDEKYIVPINNILETMQFDMKDINHVKQGSDVVNVRGEFIPIAYLSDIFKSKQSPTVKKDKLLIVLVESGRNKLGIVVDNLLGQQQVVIKNLEENSDKVSGISGATILGDGNVSLILDIAQIYNMNQEKLPDNVLKIA